MSKQINNTTETNDSLASVNGMIGKILVVDDEPGLRKILVQALNSQNYDAHGAGSGAQALERLRAEDFDLLLSDLMMPEMDGLDLLQGAAEIDPHLVCIMMTGQGTIQTAVDAMKRGAFDYILKPFRIETMMPVLTRAMNTRHLLVENVQLREAVAIHELSQTIAYTLDPETVLSKLADSALHQSQADEVSVLLPTADGQDLYVAAVRGEKRERLLGERIPFDKSIAGWVGHELMPLILNGEVHDPRFVALWPRTEIQSSISVPMQVANKLVGVLNLNLVNRTRRFTLGQMKALSILAGTAAAALESASLHSKIQAAEENYRSIFENSIEGIFQATHHGRYTNVNPAMARILGYDSPTDLIETITNFDQQLFVDAGTFAHALKVIKKEDSIQDVEVEAYRKNGAKIWLSMNIRAVPGEGGEEGYCEGTIEDITQRRSAAEEMRKLSSIVENSTDFIGIALPDGPVLFVNPTGKRMVGLASDEEVRRTNLLDYVAGEDLEGQRQEILAAILRDGHWEGETLFRNFETGATIPMLQNVFMIRGGNTDQPLLATICRDVSERKRAEAELRFQKTLLESQSEASIDGILVVSTERKILSFNRRFVEMWGISDTELGSRSDETALKGVVDKIEKPGEFLEGINYLYNHPQESSRDELQLTDGRTFDRYSAPIKSVDDEYYGRVWFFRDVTENKRAEAQLRQSEERYRDLVENAHDIIYSHDLQGNYTSSNKAGEEITGYTLAESLKLNLQDTIAPEYIEKAREMLSRKLAGEKVTAYELEIIAKDGSRVPIEVNTRLVYQDGVPVGVTGVARDISERKRVQADLVRLAAAVEQTADSILITDSDGRIEYANPAFSRLTGYSVAEVVGQNPRILKSGKNDPSIYRELWETITRGDVWTGQLINRKKDGTEFTERATISAVRDDSGRIVNYIAVKQDTTQELQLQEQLRQSQKLEAIGQLAGGVAHDFNNLLTVINGYSDLTLMRIAKEDPVFTNVEQIKKAGERAASLTRQLLAFSRKQVLQPTVLKLNAIVADIEKMLRRLIGEDIDLFTLLSPSLGQVKADPGQVEQVILNLAVNARDAMPQGGKLTIETSNVYLDNEYTRKRKVIRPGNYVMLAVSDTGTGMDSDTQARLFEPFFTTKGQGKGTGLGLSTVYGIVRQSEGDICVYSELGKGTTFKVYLPRVDEIAQVDVVPESLADQPRGRETVLLAEDEEPVRRLARVILEMQGYQVLEAASGDEALSRYEEHEGRIDLIITDVVMPGTSGRELAQSLEDLSPGIKMLFMSGYTDDAIVRHGLLNQEMNFLQKPFTSDALLRKVREVLDATRDE